MKEPCWVLGETVAALHDILLAEFGGSSGVRDSGLLDSALNRPQNLLAYGNPTIFELAASYAFGLVKNHPFVDGNKRVAFVVAITFLETNDFYFSAPESDAVVQTLALAAGEMREEEYASWLALNSVNLLKPKARSSDRRR